MSNILGFVLNTLSQWADDPTNTQYFFPDFLSRLENGKYVPYNVSQWTMSTPDLTAQSGPFICNNWALIQDSFPPGDQGVAGGPATLTMTNVVINGLNNLLVGDPVITALAGNEMQATYTAQLNTYTPPTALPFSLTGNFSLNQPCCSAPAHSQQCDGQMHDDVIGTGTFVAVLKPEAGAQTPQLTLPLTFSFQEGPFQMNVSIPAQGLAFQGGIDVTQIHINDDNQGYDWTEQAQILFSQAQTQEQILAAFTAEMNQPSNLQSLANAIQSQVNTIVTQLGGSSTYQGNVPSDQFFLDLIKSGVSNPSSKVYLPGMVQRSTNPVLEPLSIISGTKDLGQQTIPSIDTQVDLQLSDVTLAGLSNVDIQPANIQVNGNVVSFLAEFSKLPNLPPQLTLAGSIQVSNQQDGTLAGTFSLAIVNASIQGAAAITGDDAASITIELQSMTLQPLPAKSITATVNLQNTAQFFDNLVAQLVESSTVLTPVIAQINQAIANNLAQVSTKMTIAARNMLQHGLSAAS